MIAKDCWYVVATSAELMPGQPLAVELAGMPLVLWRSAQGRLLAMDDRCAHRLAPLSMGRIEGDSLRCMYHGIRFNADGRAVEVPGQEGVPRSFVQRRFEAVEQSGWIWVWLGEAETADRSLLPATPYLDRSAWQVEEGGLVYDVDYQLINDNLCDFSHIAFVHETTLSGGTDAWARKPVKITDLPRGHRFERWLVNVIAMGFEGLPERVDGWTTYDYLLPGVLIMDTRFYPVGTASRLEGQEPVGVTPLHCQASTQTVTPLGPRKTRYRYAGAVRAGEPADRIKVLFQLMEAAFAEDQRMIEAQQRMIDRSPGRMLSATQHDRAPVRFRRLIEAQGAFDPASAGR